MERDKFLEASLVFSREAEASLKPKGTVPKGQIWVRSRYCYSPCEGITARHVTHV